MFLEFTRTKDGQIMKHKNIAFTGKTQLICTLFICLIIVCNLAEAEDWATYQHDNHRSGVTSDSLDLPLSEQWRYISEHRPQQAWSDPAKQDFWHNRYGLRAKVRYDQTFHVVAVGDAMYFGSSANDKVYCLDVSTGQERWSFFTGGPVRLAPTVWDNKVYFGSDDGYVYCLKAKDGELIWKYRASPSSRMIPGNSRMISAWPVRSSVIIKDDVAYFGAGLFPKENVYLCALDARDGTELWKETATTPLQGYLLASDTRLYVPVGRTAPAVFNREDGKHLGNFSSPGGEGGTYALLTGDSLVSGPGTALRAFDAQTRDHVATFSGRRMIVTNEVSYLLSDSELTAIDRAIRATADEKRASIATERKELAGGLANMREERKELEGEELETLDKKIDSMVTRMTRLKTQLRQLKDTEYRWRQGCSRTYHSMILAGDLLFLGGDDEVVAFSALDGQQVWNSKTMGAAYGLAAANGYLFVSTDEGVIHCFGQNNASTPREVVSDKQLSPYPEDELTEKYASAAERIVNETGIKKGYCLVLGCGEGRLAYELAKRTELQIVGIEENEEKVAAARERLDKAGLYGVRVSIHQGSLKSLPYTDYFANLIVTDSDVSISPGELFRVLRPNGGMAYQGYISEKLTVTRPDGLDGAGEWTHQYANPGNSASSGDRLVRGPMQVQWFGKPGPSAMIDRHNRALAPLSKDGRLFVPAAGENRIIAVDAYNGTILWDVEVPDYRRVGANKDAGNMVVTDDLLYVATENSCWALDVETGKHMMTLKVPPVILERNWGYVASVDNLLFGSGQKKNASLSEHSRSMVYEVYFDSRPIATSDFLFCLNRHNGNILWHYQRGVIINSAVGIGDGQIYFIESRNPAAMSEKDGRIKASILLESGHSYLVALDMQTGRKAWEQQVDLPFEHTMSLSYANETILLVGASNAEGHPRYDLFGFDAFDGSAKWSNYSARTGWGTNGDHGEQDQHAVIVGDNVYMIESYSFNLQNGQQGSYKLSRGGHGCGTLSGAGSYLFARGGNPRMYEITDEPESGFALTNVSRPGCWINIIPAGGLVLIPEFSSGCTCAYPIQTSIAFIPQNGVD